MLASTAEKWKNPNSWHENSFDFCAQAAVAYRIEWKTSKRDEPNIERKSILFFCYFHWMRFSSSSIYLTHVIDITRKKIVDCVKDDCHISRCNVLALHSYVGRCTVVISVDWLNCQGIWSTRRMHRWRFYRLFFTCFFYFTMNNFSAKMNGFFSGINRSIFHIFVQTFGKCHFETLKKITSIDGDSFTVSGSVVSIGFLIDRLMSLRSISGTRGRKPFIVVCGNNRTNRRKSNKLFRHSPRHFFFYLLFSSLFWHSNNTHCKRRHEMCSFFCLFSFHYFILVRFEKAADVSIFNVVVLHSHEHIHAHCALIDDRRVYVSEHPLMFHIRMTISSSTHVNIDDNNSNIINWKERKSKNTQTDSVTMTWHINKSHKVLAICMTIRWIFFGLKRIEGKKDKNLRKESMTAPRTKTKSWTSKHENDRKENDWKTWDD